MKRCNRDGTYPCGRFRGLFVEQELVIQVLNVNESPTLVTLDGTTTKENRPAGTLVGTLGATDPDMDDSHIFSIAGGDGQGQFKVEGKQLLTQTVLNYEESSSLTLVIRATDPGGLHVEKSFTIEVEDLNEAPTSVSLQKDSVREPTCRKCRGSDPRSGS